MKIKRVLIIFVIVLIAGLLLNTYRINENKLSHDNLEQSEQKKELKKIKLVFPQALDDLKLLYDFSEEKGFFYENNLEVEAIIPIAGSAQTLFAGKADVAIVGSSGSFTAYLNDIQVRLLANIMHPFKFYISRFPKDNIASIKKMGTRTFTTEPWLQTIEVLKVLNIDRNNIEFVQGQDALMSELLNKKEVDLFGTSSEKLLYDINAMENYTIIYPEDISRDSILMYSIVSMESVIEAKSQELEDFTKAIFQTKEYIKNNKEETVKFVQEKYDISEERAKERVNRFVIAGEDVEYIPDLELTKQLLKLVEEGYGIKSDRGIDGIIYPDFAKKAIMLNEK